MTWTRLIRFKAKETGGTIHYGQPVDATQDVGRAIAGKTTVKAHEIIAKNPYDPAAKLTDKVLTVAELLTPLAQEDVPIVAALGLNYVDHLQEAAHLAGKPRARIPANPILFYKPSTALIPTAAAIVIPPHAQPVEDHLPDYEVELAVIIGKPAKDVSEEDALDYVLGYTGANDVSFRKWQQDIPQWCFSKGFDNTNPLGPVLVAASAIEDPQNVTLKSTLNGKVVQKSNTGFQIFNVRKTIAFLSQGTTLRPGTVILTGTPAGVGFVRKEKLWLKNGDTIEIELGNGIGTLVNPVKEEQRAKAKL